MENQKIIDFWSWFQDNEKKIFDSILSFKEQMMATSSPPTEEPVMFEKLSNRMKRVHPGLTFEFNSELDNENKLLFFVSPNGQKELFSLVMDVVNASPSLNYFQTIAFKQAASEEFLKDSKLFHSGKTSSLKDIYFDYVEREEGRLDFTFYVKGFNGDIYSALEQLFPILDKLIGEYYVATMIGGIDIEPLEKKNKRDLFELLTLRDMVEVRTGQELVDM